MNQPVFLVTKKKKRWAFICVETKRRWNMMRRQGLSQTAADQTDRGDATIVPIQSSKKQTQRPNIVIRGR